MTLDHSALWSMYASLEELRGKIGHVLKCAIQMSKVAWSNVIAKRCQSRKRRPSATHPFQHHQSAAQLWVAAQAVEGLVPLPTVAKPYQGLGSLTGPPGRLATPCAMPTGPIPATVAAEALLDLMPEAPDEVGVPNLRLAVYTCSDHRTSFQLGLWSWPVGCWLGSSPDGPFFCTPVV